jgi:CBS domain-containing protein
MKAKPPIVRDYMTRLPVEAERCRTVCEAIELMDAHAIRHIPVMNGSHLIGIVTERDVLKARIEFGKRISVVSLADICQRDVLSISPVTPINEVVRRMLGRNVGSAVVVDGGFVVGIFTTTDALRVLRDIFSD